MAQVASVTGRPGQTAARHPARRRFGAAGPWCFAVVAFLVAVHAAWLTFQPWGAFTEMAFSDISAIFASAIAGASCIVASRRVVDRRGRRAWLLIGLGMLAWSAGEMIWSWYEIVRHIEVPYPSVADIGFLAMPVLSIAGIACLVPIRHGGLRLMLDGLTISAAVLFVSWATVLGTAFAASDQPTLLYVVSLAYPFSDVAMVSMVTLLVMHTGRASRRPLGLLALGLVAFAIADSAFAYLAQFESYASGAWIDTPWMAGFLLIALSGQCVAGTGCGGSVDRRPESVWPLISFLPLGAATVTSAVLYSLNDKISPFLYILTLAIVVLVLTRQTITLSDNVRLNHRLTEAVRDLRRRESQLSRLAFHDPLTGLANRSLFHDRVEHACTAAVRDGRAVGVLYIDLDDFKQINDRYGHAAGDAVLIEVGRRLRDCLRPEDTMGRLGGDEFAVLVEHVERRTDLDDLTRRLSRELGRPFELDGLQIPLSASIGVALHEPAGGVPPIAEFAPFEAAGTTTADQTAGAVENAAATGTAGTAGTAGATGATGATGAAVPDGSTSTAAGTEPVSELLRRADLAMYAAKVAGKGKAVTIQRPVQSLQTDVI